MKLIVGLGNPGKGYADTRHNIGSLIVEALAKQNAVTLKKGLFSCWLAARARIDNNEVLLAVPLTYMNLSGRAVKGLLKKHSLLLSDILVVCDDADIEFSRIKVKTGGSSGGHRGLASIIDSVGSSDFARLKAGIGRPKHTENGISDYVLSSFSRKEKEELAAFISLACDCCKTWVVRGIDVSMSEFNKK